jgi:cytochrome c oxidase subunit II
MRSHKAISNVLVAVVLALTGLAAPGAQQAKVIKISAKRFAFTPSEITIKKGTPVRLELTTEDRKHGFNIEGMNVRADIEPGKVSELVINPQKTGQYDFYCDIFCGSGHESMTGKITVTD